MALTDKKCLFLVQGEGRGHLMQSVAMKQLLESSGIKVCEVLVGTNKHRTIPRFYFDRFDAQVSPVESPAMSAGKHNKAIKFFPSTIHLIGGFPQFIYSLFQIHRKVKEHNPDIIINFYEPMAGLYYFFFRPKIPILCIGHNYIYNHPEYKSPKGSIIARLGLKLWTGLVSLGSRKKLALSFYPFEDCKKKSIYVIPPLLRTEVLNQHVGDDDYLVIYLLNSGYMEDIIQWHKKNPDVLLHCFLDKTNIADCIPFDSTLFFHQINDNKFLAMLAYCRGLVTTAGFESICEAMYLNKPVFMVPVEGNYEQVCNALDAAQAGAGIYNKTFEIDRFLSYISLFEKDNKEFREWVNQSRLITLKHIFSVLMQDDNIRSINTQLPLTNMESFRKKEIVQPN